MGVVFSSMFMLHNILSILISFFRSNDYKKVSVLFLLIAKVPPESRPSLHTLLVSGLDGGTEGVVDWMRLGNPAAFAKNKAVKRSQASQLIQDVRRPFIFENLVEYIRLSDQYSIGDFALILI